METARLMAHRREGKDNGTARRLRREGKVPAVLYGHGTEEAIAVDASKLQGILQSEGGEHPLIDLFINGNPPERCHVRLCAVQTEAVSRAPLHVDLYRVSIDRTGSGDAAGATESMPEGGTVGEQEVASRNPIYVTKGREALRTRELLC